MAQDEWVDDADEGEWTDDNPKTSKLESAVRGAGQGVSLGFWDELAGLGEAVGQSVGVKGLGEDLGNGEGLSFVKPLALDPDRDFGQVYEEGRDKWRGQDKIAKQDNPGTYGAGEVAGSVGSAFIPGLNVAKGANIGNIAAKAALSGGLSGAGYSEADNLKDLARDSAVSAGIGGVTGGVAGAVVPKLGEAGDFIVNKLKGGSDEVAESLAARALGAERGTIKKLGMDKVKAAGRQALDEGVLSPLANTDDLIARNSALKKRGGEMMGEAYKAIDDAGASTFNPLDVASKVDEELGGFYRSPINRGETNQLENTLESIVMRGDKNIPLSEAQLLKEELGKVANWKNTLNPTDKERMARQAYGIVNSSIDDAISKGSDAVNKAGLTDVLARGKELYGRSSTAAQLLENKNAREQGNKMFGLTDTIMGAGALGYGGYTQDWDTALGVMAAKKGFEKYGAQNGAMLFDKVSQQLAKSPSFAKLASTNPQAFNAAVTKMTQKLMGEPPERPKQEQAFNSDSIMGKVQGTKYATVLQNAKQRGDSAFGATNFVLQQTDPEYRRKVLEQEENQ